MSKSKLFATLLFTALVFWMMSRPISQAFAQTETETPTDTATETLVPTATDTPTDTPLPTTTDVPTETLVPTATDVPATAVPSSTPLPTVTPFNPYYSLSNRITYGDYMIVAIQLAQCGVVILAGFAIWITLLAKRK